MIIISKHILVRYLYGLDCWRCCKFVILVNFNYTDDYTMITHRYRVLPEKW